ncbi:MAG: toprim domain-containing protein [Pseudomonadota bacterium]
MTQERRQQKDSRWNSEKKGLAMPSLSPAEAQDWAPHIVTSLGGRWFGDYGTCRCPAHEDRKPSLSVAAGDSAILVKCHSGCEASDVIDALKARGLWPSHQHKCVPNPRSKVKTCSQKDKAGTARWLWNQAKPVPGTLAERYLEKRYFKHRASAELRFLPDSKHGPSGKTLPCLVAAVRTPDGRLKGIHRTHLDPATGDKADLDDCRLWLGPCRTNAVHLGDPKDGLLGIAEGLETGDSASSLYGIPVWVALSASNLSLLTLPDCVKRIVIFGDNDVPGHKAALAAWNAYSAQGRASQIVFPLAGFGDFNDMVCAGL